MTKYHISPTTGNPNLCKAAKGACPFGYNEPHFTTKDEARAHFESVMEIEMNADKILTAFKKEFFPHIEALSIEDYSFRKISEDTSQWSKNDVMALKAIVDTNALLQKGGELTEEEKEKLYEIYNSFKRAPRKTSWSSADKPERLRHLEEVLKDLYIQKAIRDYTLPDVSNTAPDTSAFLGVNEATQAVLQEWVDMELLEEDDFTEEKINEATNRIKAGQKWKPFYDAPQFTDEEELFSNASAAPKEHKLFARVSNSNQAEYLATIFPRNELADHFKAAGISNVSVSPMINSRETGLVYSVMQPDGNIRSFSVYEHRNTDSIIINGKTNWNPNEGLPYVADTAHAFFGEISNREYKQAARQLTYFIKQAQKGELEDDITLAKNSERIDWDSKLENLIPGFKNWKNEHFPEQDLDDDPRKLGF